ncbi:hypothetical protein MRX96_008707 [Rhipicephalus microplus]
MLRTRRPELLGFLAFGLCCMLSRQAGELMPREKDSWFSDKGGAAASFKDVLRKKLVVFLADGLRWDYVDRHNYCSFRSMEKRGFRAGRLVPVFPSLSYPNWYSLVTGECEEAIILNLH